MEYKFKIAEVLNLAQKQLRDSGFDSGLADAQLLNSFVLDCSCSDLYLKYDCFEPEQKKQFDQLLKDRISGQPVKYLTNSAYFFGLEFYVKPGVLIPRPETEILVQTILDKVRPLLAKEDQVRASILDIGTGSGNISIVLTKNQVSCKIVAIDLSEEAISTAGINAQKHEVSDKIEFKCLDCKDIDSILEKEQLKLIVSNPPYIRSEDIDCLDKEVRQEPRLALDGGGDGLKFYNLIIKQASIYLQEHGYLALEIGQDQAEAVTDIIKKTGKFQDIEVIQDLNNRDRVVLARRFL